MYFKKGLLSIFSLASILYGGLEIRTLESTKNRLILRVETTGESPEDIKPMTLLLGLPTEKYPKLSISKAELTSHNFKVSSTQKTGWLRHQKLNGLFTASLHINPANGKGQYWKKQIITIIFQTENASSRIPTTQQELLLAPKIHNWNIAKHWMIHQKIKHFKSVIFNEGKWLKFSVSEDGMRRISASTIHTAIGTGETIEPRSIMVFTGSSLGRDRTYDLTQNIGADTRIPENLMEIAIEIIGEQDGLLHSEDEIRFWGRGPSGFDINGENFSWHQNLYFTENTYWLFIPEDSALRGKRVQTSPEVTPELLTLEYGLSAVHLEVDKINPFESGLGWADVSINTNGTLIKDIELPHPVPTVQANGKIGFLGGEAVETRYGNTQHQVSVKFENLQLATLSWANLGQKSASFTVSENSISNGTNSFEFSNTSSNPNSTPYFDYLDLTYGRKLTTDQGDFTFVAPIKGHIATFIIEGSESEIWDISEPGNPQKIPTSSLEDQTRSTVQLPEDNLAHFSVFNSTVISEVSSLTIMGNKQFNVLRNSDPGVSHLIIGPDIFKNSSSPLVEHRGNSRFIPLESIYDEFSGGNPDPMAIRHFLQWTQEYWMEPRPYCAFLLGDTDYDYRNITGQSQNILPTIEVGILYSHATDDRLASFNGFIPEIALGRYPAKTVEEVDNFVEKIIEFESHRPPGAWKQRVTLVADDPARPERELYELPTGKSHTANSERLNRIIPPFMEVNKLYMVEYPEVSDGTMFGVTKPEATKALFQSVSEGTVLINYIGHGNPKQWAQEKLLYINEDRNDAQALKAEMKLPIWIAGTCNWGHFDQLGEESFAEELIRIPMDGASAIISTTRGITVSSNIMYLERIFKSFFPDGGLTSGTVGTVLQSVKTGGTDGELFHLFGDPGMPVPIPDKLITDAVVSSDSLKTLEIGTVSGSHPLSNGEGIITLQDGSKTVSKEFNFLSTTQEISYEQNGPVLFRGRFSFEEGAFASEFRVPKDITYSPNPSNIRFILNSNESEAIGGVGNITLLLGPPSTDTEGPIITFETDLKRILRSGDHLNPDETLVIRLSDPLGINISGETGHELYLKNHTSKETEFLSGRFVYDLNSLTTGIISYPLPNDLEKISLKVQAWDNANNPSEQEILLSRLLRNKLTLLHVLNFPNPFEEQTQFTFELTSSAEVSVDIYTLGGRRIKTLYPVLLSMGYHALDWDGRDAYGNPLANGVYLYRIRAKNHDQSVSAIGRLAKFR